MVIVFGGGASTLTLNLLCFLQLNCYNGLAPVRGQDMTCRWLLQSGVGLCAMTRKWVLPVFYSTPPPLISKYFLDILNH